MRTWKRGTGNKWWPEGEQRVARFLILPVAAIILVLLIIIADNPSKKKDASVSSEQSSTVQAVTEPAEPESGGTMEMKQNEITQNEIKPDEIPELKQDEIPELTALVRSYCQAKTDCEPSELDRVFGRESGSEEEQEAWRSEMERISRMVEGYENITCYHIDGPEPGTYVIYPYFEIQYKDAQMLMPSLTWAYAVQGEDGDFYMTQDISDSVAEYIAGTGQTEAVKALVAQVNESQAEAVAADQVLRQIYDENARNSLEGGSSVEIVAP